MHVHRLTYPAAHVAFVLYAGSVEALPQALAPLLDAVRQAGAPPLGPPLVLYPSAAQNPDSILARICVPVRATFLGSHRVRTLTLPPVDVAVVRHVGPHRDIGKAYEALSAWIGEPRSPTLLRASNRARRCRATSIRWYCWRAGRRSNGPRGG